MLLIYLQTTRLRIGGQSYTPSTWDRNPRVFNFSCRKYIILSICYTLYKWEPHRRTLLSNIYLNWWSQFYEPNDPNSCNWWIGGLVWDLVSLSTELWPNPCRFLWPARCKWLGQRLKGWLIILGTSELSCRPAFTCSPDNPSNVSHLISCSWFWGFCVWNLLDPNFQRCIHLDFPSSPCACI